MLVRGARSGLHLPEKREDRARRARRSDRRGGRLRAGDLVHRRLPVHPGQGSRDAVTIDKTNTSLLMEAARRLDEWKVLARKIPGVDYVPVLKSRDVGEPVSLSPPEWNLITRIDGMRTVEELARADRLELRSTPPRCSTGWSRPISSRCGLATRLRRRPIRSRPPPRRRPARGRPITAPATVRVPERPPRPGTPSAPPAGAGRREENPHDPLHTRQAGGRDRHRRVEPARHRSALQAGARRDRPRAAGSRPSAI